jgi:acetolactate synthase-1/2/3 large subunit
MSEGQSGKAPSQVDRRKFLAGMAAGGAAAVAGADAKASILPGGAPTPSHVPSAGRPTYAMEQAESGPVASAGVYPGVTHGKPGSDYMVDVFKTLDIPYVITNPASSCRGFHESLVNYGGNRAPELLTAMHEEIATGMAHGYYKVAGKMLGSLCHGTVGLQHAAMAIYNAWCDRVPVMMLTGNSMDAAERRPLVPTLHAAQDPAAFVRDFTKWDDQPASLQHFAESMVRGYKIAITPPTEPVLIVLDEELQEHAHDPGPGFTIPRLSPTQLPQGDSNAIRDAARTLVAAENPVIVADRATRTQRGVDLIVELAETLGAVVVDQTGRMNMPTRHYLYRRGGNVAQADVVLGLELTDFFGTVNNFIDAAHPSHSQIIRPGTKLISITMADVYIRANYQDFQRYQPVDIAMAADVETTLPALIEEIRASLDDAARTRVAGRISAAQTQAQLIRENDIAAAAADAWNGTPISCARMCTELWPLIQNEDWGFVSRDATFGSWPRRFWDFTRNYQWIGGPGGHGQGYHLPAAVGAALAHRDAGRIAINIQGDGDFMFTNSSLWTAAHHNIPLLTIVHNNRAYHQEVMHLQRMCSWRERGYDEGTWRVATTIENPNVDFATLARSMGVEGIGPIDNPNDLASAYARAIDIVKNGRPVVVDVLTQPR